MITNSIRVATVKSYADSYAVCELKSAFGETSEKTIEEIILTVDGLRDQNLPDVGADVLIAFDDLGDTYLLRALACENQALPAPESPTLKRIANDKVSFTLNPDGSWIFENEKLRVKGYVDGTIEIKNGLGAVEYELIEILVDLVTELTTTTAGGDPLSSQAALIALLAKLTTFKVV